MSSGEAPELSVVLPFRNQADHLQPLVRRWLTELGASSLRVELILVPNACTDDTVRLCRELAGGDDRVRVVESALGGWGRAVRLGLEAARGRWICYTNSARTEPATVAGALSLLLKNPGALVKVVRRERGHFLREFGSMLYNLECRLLFGLQCRDVNGTPKLFARELLGRIQLSSAGDLLDAEILAKCRRLRVPVLEIPLGGWGRHGGRSSTGIASAWRMYAGAARMRWRREVP